MTYFVVLFLIALGAIAYVERDKILELVSRVQKAKAPNDSQPVRVETQAPPHVAPEATIVAPKETTGSDNWLIDSLKGQANPNVPQAPVGPSDDDTQRPDSLDNTYAQRNTVFVGSKTLTGPGKVEVKINITSKLGGTQFPCSVSIGDRTWTLNTSAFDPVVVDTPVTVSASTPVVMQFKPA